MKKRFFFLVLLLITPFVSSEWTPSQIEKSAFRSSQFDSFDEVWRQVSMNPWSPEPDPFDVVPKSLPSYPGVSNSDLLDLMGKKFKLLFNSKSEADMDPWNFGGKTDFGERTRELFTDSANFKEAGVKWLHPRGVCVKGTWSITESSPATGLFAKGAEVPMIMRLSTGTEASERYYKGEIQARLYGLAIKLFHEQDNSQKALTSNIITLDQRGFSRSDRPFMLIPKKNRELFFTNVAPVESIFGSETPILTGAGKALSWALDIFDNPNFARPVYVSASFDQHGDPVSEAVTPFKLKFVPHFKEASQEYEDFRLELLDYQEGYFDIVINQLIEGEDFGDQKIGEIRFDFPMILTHNCDLRLAFHHSPVTWKKKYENDKLVRDKLSE